MPSLPPPRKPLPPDVARRLEEWLYQEFPKTPRQRPPLDGFLPGPPGVASSLHRVPVTTFRRRPRLRHRLWARARRLLRRLPTR